MSKAFRDEKLITSTVRKQPAIKPDQITSSMTSILCNEADKDFVYILFWADWCKFCPQAKMGLVDLLLSPQNHNLPSLAIYQCEMHTIEEVRLHPEIRHPHSPWPEEKITITSIPTTVLIRVPYVLPSLFSTTQAMQDSKTIAQWVNYCIYDLSQ